MKQKSKNPRRFRDEQIKSLESIFELETKLEPRIKLKLARDLGLQPRQVAIWFQNRRARWKSKQLEREYDVLKANYDDLCLQFELLKMEKQSLCMQLQELRDLLNDHHGDAEFGVNPRSLDHGEDCKGTIHVQEPEFLSLGVVGDNPIASPETWCNLESDGLFAESCGTSNWWEDV